MRLRSDVRQRGILSALVIVALLCIPFSLTAFGRQKRKPSGTRKPAPVDTVAQLRDEYIKATKEYKQISERLLVLQEGNARRAEERLEQTKKLFDQGLVAKRDLEESQNTYDVARARVEEVRQQIAKADTDIAETLVEIQTEKQLARTRLAPGGLLRTTSFIRFNGAANWLLSNAGTVQGFFQQKFHRPLPIAVFGQGAIHDRWRLDHRNAMDISLYPDSVEGQALMEFLRANGIPFSAFRSAIPGTATGPHIHIGRPSHRY